MTFFPLFFSRVLLCFQSRKAHRVHVRDKDLFKYLGCFIVIVVGYMVAWTAVSLDYTRFRHFAGVLPPPSTQVSPPPPPPPGYNDMLVKGRIAMRITMTTPGPTLEGALPNVTSAETSATKSNATEAPPTQVHYQYFRVCRAMAWDIVVQLGESRRSFFMLHLTWRRDHIS